MKKVVIYLDKERYLRFDLNAMSKFEEITNTSSFSIGENMNARTIRALLFSCLYYEDKELTVEDVGNMIDIENMNYISEKLNELIKINTPKESNNIPNEQSQN